MQVKIEELLKVKTISAKMLQQVQLVAVANPRYGRLIQQAYPPSVPEVGLIGWFMEKESSRLVWWLVKDRNQFVRLLAPDWFKPAEENVPQLFTV